MTVSMIEEHLNDSWYAWLRAVINRHNPPNTQFIQIYSPESRSENTEKYLLKKERSINKLLV